MGLAGLCFVCSHGAATDAMISEQWSEEKLLISSMFAEIGTEYY